MIEGLGGGTLVLETLFIFVLILINGFFAGSEVAVISLRRSRVQELVEAGDGRASAVQRLKDDPDRFLATIQIGINFVSTLASAIGGALAVRVIRPLLDRLPGDGLGVAGELVALGIVVVVITYLTIVFGELVPKSLGLRYAEQVALALAGPHETLARWFSLIGRPLTASSRLILSIFRAAPQGTTGFVSEEEIKLMVQEGKEKGIFDQTEQELIHSVFEFTETSVKEVMIPRPQIDAIELDTPLEEALQHIVDTGYSRYPVYRKSLDDICGVLYYKDLLRLQLEHRQAPLQTMIHPAFFVPETMQVSQLLKELQRRHTSMAIVVDEHGGVDGLVTIEDLIEEIVGEIHDEYEPAERSVERLKDGSLIVDASLSIKDLRDEHELPFPESPEYETLAGFMLTQLQRVPKGGDNITYQGKKLTIVDMEGRRIARIKIEELPAVHHTEGGA
ncbi:MAG: HlyC/CorC family transporter [Candidatus Methylomirabilota bacterium]|nr:HlyC/CorC family transporter [candidate division NC10 bacterium]PWB48563.1 MAG: HlyC/CorC family transporter [candidate division NC10 bacterium]